MLSSTEIPIRSSSCSVTVRAKANATRPGRELAFGLNRFWTDRVRRELDLDSFLELQFERHYLRFFMPTIRGSELGSKKRYAGLVRRDGKLELQFTGLEAVRSDWTPLAREFQRELYRRIFHDEPYEDYIHRRPTICSRAVATAISCTGSVSGAGSKTMRRTCLRMPRRLASRSRLDGGSATSSPSTDPSLWTTIRHTSTISTISTGRSPPRRTPCFT